MSEQSASSRDQLLTLKVMRLTRPTFYNDTAIAHEIGDPFAEALGSALVKLRGQQDLGCAVSNSLVLPQSFENIYLGETFSCYVCVHNDSSSLVTDVSLKVDLQTQTQRVSLPGLYHEGNIKLDGEQTLGEVINHEVKEVGQHILVCAVTYTTPAGEIMYFRKFFKFPVAKPLDVRTKFYNAESDEVYLEAQIQNTTQAAMVLEKVILDPSDLYNCAGLNLTDMEGAQASNSECMSYLSPQDTRQFLYRLSQKEDIAAKCYRGVTPIGKLDMVWRTSLGERGRLQTSQLQRMAPGYGDLRLTVEEVPGTVQLNQIFKIVCRLRNCCDRSLDLDLTLDSTLQTGLVWVSLNQSVGQLEGNSMQDIVLELKSVTPGLQSISGIRLTDTFLKRTYEHDEIAQVFVWA